MTIPAKHEEILKLRLTIEHSTNMMNAELRRLRVSGISENARPGEEARIRSKYDASIRGSHEMIQKLINSGR